MKTIPSSTQEVAAILELSHKLRLIFAIPLIYFKVFQIVFWLWLATTTKKVFLGIVSAEVVGAE